MSESCAVPDTDPPAPITGDPPQVNLESYPVSSESTHHLYKIRSDSPEHASPEVVKDPSSGSSGDGPDLPLDPPLNDKIEALRPSASSRHSFHGPLARQEMPDSDSESSDECLSLNLRRRTPSLEQLLSVVKDDQELEKSVSSTSLAVMPVEGEDSVRRVVLDTRCPLWRKVWTARVIDLSGC